MLYHEDKLLLTNEDFVPVIEIDETFTSNLHNDFYWLMKVRCWKECKLTKVMMCYSLSQKQHVLSLFNISTPANLVLQLVYPETLDHCFSHSIMLLLPVTGIKHNVGKRSFSPLYHV